MWMVPWSVLEDEGKLPGPENKKTRTSQCRPLGSMRWMFYALIAGLLEVGVIVPIVVHARAVAGHGDCWAELEGGEGHAPIVLDLKSACKR